jgi:enoyl-CoA hydratase/carnithine racemase
MAHAAMGVAPEGAGQTGLSGDGEPLSHVLDGTTLRVIVSGRRADVVLDDPQRRNPQTPRTWLALAAAAEWLDDRVDVVVLRATGPSFSAGLDRGAFSPQGLPGEPGLVQLAALPEDEIDPVIATFQRGFSLWSDSHFLSIAAVQGHAIGAGFQLALAADLRIAADDVQLAMREPTLGLVPDLGGTKPLVDAVGYPRALEICATGRAVGAAEALALGLVQRVVPAAGLTQAVDETVQALLAADMGAILATRALLRDAGGRDGEQQRAAERAAQIGRLRVLLGRA